MKYYLEKLPIIWKLAEKFNLIQVNKSESKNTNLKIDKQFITNNYYINFKSKNRKWNFKKYKNDIRNKKIIILDSENDFPEKQLLVRYWFKNIEVVKSLEELKKKRDIWAIIYRYRLEKCYQQQELKKTIFGLFMTLHLRQQLATLLMLNVLLLQ